MNIKNISLEASNQVSLLIKDYINNSEQILPFFEYENTLEGFKKKIDATNFPTSKRELLIQQLKHQYEQNDIELPSNIRLLKDEHTYVITTGHQLCLFGGPQYFIHKIVSIIKLCITLKKAFPSSNFVPLFWLASEDHDFEEISEAHIYRSSLKGDTNLKGVVGKMPMSIFENAYKELFELVGDKASFLKTIFNDKLENTTLTKATTTWVDKLFKDYNLVILDGDDKALKTSFSEIIKNELLDESSFNLINKSSKLLKEKGYKTQVTPREINLFYIIDNLRERIVLKDNKYSILNTGLSFTKEEILEELSCYPERFSPNSIFRPVYQEFSLPNLAYIGGPGELAYWLQLKSNFNRLAIPFPILTLRDLLIITDSKTIDSIEKMNLQLSDFFKSEDDLIKQYLSNNDETKVEFKNEYELLLVLKQKVISKIERVDKSLKGLVESEFVKMQKGIDRINQKTQRSIKQKEEVNITKIKNIRAKIAPNGKLAERKFNFIPNYLRDSKNYIAKLISISDTFVSEIKTLKQ